MDKLIKGANALIAYLRSRPLIPITALGLLLRLIRWDFQPLWFDEGYSFYFATSSLAQLLARTAVDIHPPLYYLLLKGWMALFGMGVLQARLFSIAMGTVTIPALYILGRRLAGRQVGLWAALALAVSPFHIYYSQEVRMYGLVTLLSVLASSLALRAFEGHREIRAWIGAGVALLGAFYTQYYALLVPIALTVYLLLRPRLLRRSIGPWLVTLAGVCLAYLPWLLYALPRLVVYVQYKVGKDADLPLSAVEFARRILVAYGAGHLEGWLASWWWLGLIPPALLVLGLLALWAADGAGKWLKDAAGRQTIAFALIYAVVPLMAGYGINRVAPFNPPRSERLWLLTLPAFCLLAGFTIHRAGVAGSRMRARIAGCAALICLVIAGVSLSAFYTVPRYAPDDYRPIAAEIAARGLPTDAVICVFPWQVGYLEAYWKEPHPVLVETPSQIYPEARQFWADEPALMRADLDQLMARHGRLWLPAYLASGSPLEEDMADYLDRIGIRSVSDWFGNTHLSLHVALPALTPLQATAEFGGHLRVEQMALNREAVESAYGTLVVTGRWAKIAPFAEDYHIVLRLTDDQGRGWQQWDRAPSLGRRPFSVWTVGEMHEERLGLLIDAGLPPGHYQLHLSVRGSDEIPLPLTSAGAEEGATEALLGTVEIGRPAQPVAPAALAIGVPDEATFGDQIRLLGHTLSEGPLVPGEELNVTLFWECVAPVEKELVVFVQLLDSKGKLAAASELPPTAGFFPTTRWQAGDLIRDRHAVRLPASLADGSYRVIVGLFEAAGGARWPITAGDRRHADYVELGRVSVRGRPHDFNPPAPMYGTSARFGDIARLVGYDLNQETTESGAVIRVVLYWQALRDGERPYAVFVHLYNAAGRRIAQHDGPPGLGRLPTSGWLAGEFVADEHPLRLQPGQADLGKEIWVGLYDPATGQRVDVWDASDQLLGDHVVLE